MKRNLLILSLALLVCCNVYSKDRTLQEMQSIAFSILNKGVRKAKGPVSTFPQDSIKILEDRPTLSILGYKDGGYVVMSKDDVQTAVLAYSTAKYDTTKIAPEAKWLLGRYEVLLSKANSNNTRLTSILDGVEYTPIEPFVKTHWSQSEPYNNLCPEFSGFKCVTGCVATAAAQVFYYLRKPTFAQGYKKYTFQYNNEDITLVKDLSEFNFDYDDMIADYDIYGNYTVTQAKAVSQLMSLSGLITNMQYGTNDIFSSGSGAFMEDLADGINSFIPELKAEYTSFTANAVLSSLQQGIPCIYSGFDQTYVYGHCFIIDGCNEEGYLHCNLGWGGQDDGYYLMTDMAGYNESQDLVLVTPNTTPQAQYSPLKELESKQISVDCNPLTNIQSGKWYALYNNYAFKTIKKDDSGSVQLTSYLPCLDASEDVCSTIVRFVQTETDCVYNIQTGTGDWLTVTDGKLVTSTEKGNFKVASFDNSYISLQYNNNDNGYLSCNRFGSDLYIGSAPSSLHDAGSWEVLPLTIVDAPQVPISSIAFDNNEISVSKGDQVQLNVSITPSDASKQQLTWSSSNEYIVSVDANGQITALRGGTANIYAWSTDGSRQYGVCKVTVTPTIITFQDSNTKSYCINAYDTNNDGELSDAEAAAVATLNKGYGWILSNIEYFDEFENFVGITELSDNFQNNTKLKSIKLPSSITSIPAYAFYKCTGLESVTLPSYVTSIGEVAFYGTNLTSINLPTTVESVSAAAFGGCKQLEAINVESNANLKSVNGVVYNKDMTTLLAAPTGKKEIVIAAGVKEIAVGAFYGTYSESIILPNSLEIIGSAAFRECHGLKTIHIPAKTYCDFSTAYYNPFVSWGNIDSGNPYGSALESVTVDEANPYFTAVDGVMYSKDKKWLYCYPPAKKGNSFTIPEGTTDIFSGSFAGNKNLRCLTLPENCNLRYALEGSFIEELRLPSTITKLYFQDLDASRDYQRVVCLAATPPELDVDAPDFRYDILVPSASVQAYKEKWPKCKIKAIEEFDIREDDIHLTPGMSYQTLSYSLNTIDGEWKSLNNDIATVNQDGLVTANAMGNVDIVYSASDGAILDKCHIIVTEDFTIPFVDDGMKVSMVIMYDKDKDGDVQYSEALAVRAYYAEVFIYRDNIESMEDFKYFQNVSNFTLWPQVDNTYIASSAKYVNLNFQGSHSWEITCMAQTPPVLQYSKWYDTDEMILYVPKGTKALYEAADGWKDFNKIIEINSEDGINAYLNGDVNADKNVNVTDATCIINNRLGYESANFVYSWSDINDDTQYTIADATAVVNIIFGESISSEAKARTSQSMSESLDLYRTGNNMLVLDMNNSQGYSSFQFDLDIPEGMSVENITLNENRCKDFSLQYHETTTGHYKVVGFNFDNNVFTTGGGNLLTLYTGGTYTDGVKVSNIHFSTAKAKDVSFGDLAVGDNPTGIENLRNQENQKLRNSEIFNLSGQRVTNPTHGMYIINGTKVIKK